MLDFIQIIYSFVIIYLFTTLNNAIEYLSTIFVNILEAHLVHIHHREFDADF